VPSAADTEAMRSVIGLCAMGGSFVGGYLPVLWGASGFSVTSLLFGALGGVAGVWLGARLTA
jgi:hypothetical protein